MAVRILSNELVDPGLLAMVRSADGCMQPVPKQKGMAGSMRIESEFMPGIAMLDVAWQTPSEQLHVRDEEPSRNINIQFQRKGNMLAHFTGIGHRLEMMPGRHNLVYAPDGSDETIIPGDSSLEILHITIDRSYFMSLIGCDSLWSEHMLTNLASERPCSGMRGTAVTTPAMERIMQELHAPTNVMAPMRKLWRQSRLLELLYLQFGQFAQVNKNRKRQSLLTDDEEKLYLLKAYLDEHFLSSALTLNTLARQFQLNEFKLKSGFKQLFHTTVFGYIRDLRFSYACLLLRDGRSSEEVAYKLGFDHPQHFSAAFRKRYGHPPIQWQKMRSR